MSWNGKATRREPNLHTIWAKKRQTSQWCRLGGIRGFVLSHQNSHYQQRVQLWDCFAHTSAIVCSSYQFQGVHSRPQGLVKNARRRIGSLNCRQARWHPARGTHVGGRRQTRRDSDAYLWSYSWYDLSSVTMLIRWMLCQTNWWNFPYQRQTHPAAFSKVLETVSTPPPLLHASAISLALSRISKPSSPKTRTNASESWNASIRAGCPLLA